MKHNIITANLRYINDPEDFKMPYKLAGKIDTEILMDRYSKLRKQSYGNFIRLGIAAKGE